MTRVLRLYAGGDEINFDGSNGYRLLYEGWSPQVAQIVKRPLTALPPVLPVEEEWSIRVEGDDVDEVMERYRRLSNFGNLARQWWDGENVTARRVAYRPRTSTAVVGEDVLIPPWTIRAPSDFDFVPDGVGLGTRSNPVRLRFTRRGYWTRGSQTVAQSGVAANQPDTIVADFAASNDITGPMIVRMAMGYGSSVTGLRGVLMASNHISSIAIKEAEDVATLVSSGGSNVAIGAARGGNVRRFTASASQQSAYYELTVGQKTRLKRARVYALIKNNGNSQWLIRSKIGPGSAAASSFNFDVSGWQIIPINSETQMIYCGSYAVNNFTSVTNYVGLDLRSMATSSDTLDIDFFVHLMDDENSHATQIDLAGSGTSWTPTVNHEYMVGPNPFVSNASIFPAADFRGDTFYAMSGNRCVALWVPIGHSTFGHPATLSSIELSATQLLVDVMPR
ncbi:MAG: hypothetical protein R6X32_06130 [Chloroflexota bacterium]